MTANKKRKILLRWRNFLAVMALFLAAGTAIAGVRAFRPEPAPEVPSSEAAPVAEPSEVHTAETQATVETEAVEGAIETKPEYVPRTNGEAEGSADVGGGSQKPPVEPETPMEPEPPAETGTPVEPEPPAETGTPVEPEPPAETGTPVEPETPVVPAEPGIPANPGNGGSADTDTSKNNGKDKVHGDHEPE